MWAFNRRLDASIIETEKIIWNGPLSWTGFEKMNDLKSIPDIEGIYLFTFKYKDGYLLYAVGITKSTKRRLSEHTREYRKGNYNVLDVESAEIGERKEIWHGWHYAKTHQEEFIEKKDIILSAVEKQLGAFRIFIAEVSEKRKRERIEAAIMQNIYASKETWSELADRGMFLTSRHNSEMPIAMQSICTEKIYGLPEILEI